MHIFVYACVFVCVYFSVDSRLIQMLVLRVVLQEQNFKAVFSKLLLGFLKLTLYANMI